MTVRRGIALAGIALAVVLLIVTWPGFRDTDCPKPAYPTDLPAAVECRLAESD